MEVEEGERKKENENFSCNLMHVREIRMFEKRVDVVSGVVGRQCRGTRDAEKWKQKWKLRERRASNRFRGKHVSHPGRKRRRLGGVERPVNTKMINSSLPSFLFIPNWSKVLPPTRAGFHDENLIIKDLSLFLYIYIVITDEN